MIAVAFPRGRFVHWAWSLPVVYGYPTICHRVMAFHRDRAFPTSKPVTCRECLRRAP